MKLGVKEIISDNREEIKGTQSKTLSRAIIIFAVASFIVGTAIVGFAIFSKTETIVFEKNSSSDSKNICNQIMASNCTCEGNKCTKKCYHQPNQPAATDVKASPVKDSYSQQSELHTIPKLQPVEFIFLVISGIIIILMSGTALYFASLHKHLLLKEQIARNYELQKQFVDH